MIPDGKVISIQYTLSLNDGEVIESNLNEEPLEYTMGSGELIPGLEEVLAGMKEGEEQTGVLPPEKAYGLSLAEALLEIPKDHLPAEALEVGARIHGEGPGGAEIDGCIVKLKTKCAVVDFNHPLAGKTIAYSIKLCGVR